jgi:hypothetical protein
LDKSDKVPAADLNKYLCTKTVHNESAHGIAGSDVTAIKMYIGVQNRITKARKWAFFVYYQRSSNLNIRTYFNILNLQENITI